MSDPLDLEQMETPPQDFQMDEENLAQLDDVPLDDTPTAPESPLKRLLTDKRKLALAGVAVAVVAGGYIFTSSGASKMPAPPVVAAAPAPSPAAAPSPAPVDAPAVATAPSEAAPPVPAQAPAPAMASLPSSIPALPESSEPPPSNMPLMPASDHASAAALPAPMAAPSPVPDMPAPTTSIAGMPEEAPSVTPAPVAEPVHEASTPAPVEAPKALPDMPAAPVAGVEKIEADKIVPPVKATSLDEPHAEVAENPVQTARIHELEKKVADLEMTISQLQQDAIKSPAPAAVSAPAVSKAPAVKKTARVKKVSAKSASHIKVPVWILRAAKPGTAWVSQKGSDELKAISVGDSLPGLGMVTAIVKDSFGHWTVDASKGRISQ